MTSHIQSHDDAKARRNVIILVLAQATLGAQMPLLFTIAGLAGQALASNICWATLPISLIVFGSMTTAPWLSPVMQRFGRRVGFWIGCLGGAIGAAISAYALMQASFPLFLLGSYFTGIYMCAHGLYRFAATDLASDEYRPKAISYVMIGGLAAAVVGPQLATLTAQAMVIPFFASYLTIIAINVLGAGLFFFLHNPAAQAEEEHTKPQRSVAEILTTPRIVVAMIIAMVSYALMNLQMTSTPLAVVGCGFGQADAGNVVTVHVLAMFAPSFFTGHLINRFGVERITGIGLVILTGSGLVALSGVELPQFFGALFLLGVGWNFGFIGATAMLAGAHAPHERGRVQGLNDFAVFGLVTIASLASGGLMNCSGGDAVQGWTAVNLAMAPFLALAFAALIWLVMRDNRVAQG